MSKALICIPSTAKRKKNKEGRRKGREGRKEEGWKEGRFKEVRALE